MYRHEAPLNLFLVLFYANLGPNNGATSSKQRLALFSWGLLGKTGNFRPRRTWEYRVRATLCAPVEISPMHEPTIQ